MHSRDETGSDKFKSLILYENAPNISEKHQAVSQHPLSFYDKVGTVTTIHLIYYLHYNYK